MRETLESGYSLHVFIQDGSAYRKYYRAEVIDPDGHTEMVQGSFGGKYVSPMHAYFAALRHANHITFHRDLSTRGDW